MATERGMAIYLGADHAGYALKQAVAAWLKERKHDVRDLSATEIQPDDDYPDVADAVARTVAKEQGARGVLFCGSAEGVCIVANKTDGIRAAIGFSTEAARASRQDEDANVLCLPGRMMNATEAIKALQAFLDTPFSNAPRHTRRLQKIKGIESRN